MLMRTRKCFVGNTAGKVRVGYCWIRLRQFVVDLLLALVLLSRLQTRSAIGRSRIEFPKSCQGDLSFLYMYVRTTVQPMSNKLLPYLTNSVVQHSLVS